MFKKISLILTVVFCMAFFCSCSVETQPKYDIPTGTYRYVHEDGNVSEIILTKDTVKYVNVDFEICRNARGLLNYVEALQRSAAEGYIISDEELNAVMDEVRNYDFSVYENKELAFSVFNSFTITPLDENGEKIIGFETNFYPEEKQLVLDQLYTLVEE